MKALSIIIVNYNAKEFLTHCLESLKLNLGEINAEIIIIDNASTDGSRDYFDQLASKDVFYAAIQFVYLKENLGFSKANNIGMKMSEGELILLLNPDTIVHPNTIQSCITHFHNHSQTGAVGVRMVDGNGKFLKESKRGYPSLPTTFYKSIGLSSLFPQSRIFGKYHLGNIDKNAIAAVDVLSGAFMMIRQEVYRKTEGFDEQFFMYGEDIDLSIRIKSAGWQLYYLGNISITHFKGGSTVVGSYDHLKQFYRAMIIFVEKYYDSGIQRFLKPILITAIIIRGSLSFMANTLRKLLRASN